MKKKVFNFLLAALIAFSTVFMPTVNANAIDFVIITGREQGVVVDVLDSDALVVRLTNGSRLAYVRLVGVKANANSDALDYINANVLGKKVIIEPDFAGGAGVADGRWNLSYVYLNEQGGATTDGKELINNTLISKGYAVADEDHKNISRYAVLVSSEQDAKSSKLGVWGESKRGGWYYTGDMLNINTATASQMVDTLDISRSVASKIIEYRRYNPFYDVYEVKFVEGMTKDIFDDIKNDITVMTNINTASEKELITLIDFTKTIANKVIKYRNKDKFTSISQLYHEVDINRAYYDDNKHFITVDDDDTVTYKIPDKAVNINTASLSQIKSITGVTDSMASRIIENRKNGYTYKTLYELTKYSSSFTIKDVNKFADNFVLKTNINKAEDDELASLFGSSASSLVSSIKKYRKYYSISEIEDAIDSTRYKDIKDHVYIENNYVPEERINLNTATDSQIRNVGFSQSDTARILGKQGNMKCGKDIPVSVSNYDKYVALYTDINTASVKELKSLNAFSSTIIDKIVDYRNNQPFGSIDEVKDFFGDNGAKSDFTSVSNFIVVR